MSFDPSTATLAEAPAGFDPASATLVDAAPVRRRGGTAAEMRGVTVDQRRRDAPMDPRRTDAPKTLTERLAEPAAPGELEPGLTDTEMQQGSIAPWRAEQNRVQAAYGNTNRSPVAKAGSEPIAERAGRAVGDVAGPALGALTRGATDAALLAPEAMATTAKIGADLANLATLGAAQPVSDWLGQTVQAVQNDKSNRFQSKKAAFGRMMRDPDAGVLDVAKFMALNPDFAAEIAAPSVPSMLVGAAGARIGAALAGETGAMAGAGAANTLMNAGATFSDTRGDAGDKLLAAGGAAAGTALLGRMGGAETALATGVQGGALRGALTTGLREGAQEAGESLSQSLGQGTAEGNFSASQAAKQAAVEGVAGGLMGAAAGAAASGKPAPRPTELRKLTLDRFDDFTATHGMSPKAADTIKQATATLPLARIPSFIKNALGKLAAAGYYRGPTDDAALSMLDEPPPPPVGPTALAPAPVAPPLPALQNRLATNLGLDAPSAAPAEAVSSMEQTLRGGALPVTDQIDLEQNFTDLNRPESATAIPTPVRGAQSDPAKGVPIIVSPIDERAHSAAASPTNDRPEPTEAQKEAGNYAKGHVRINGLDVAIENPEGSVRRGIDPNGKPWETPMRAHYGYVKGSRAGDGDNSDLFIKPGTAPDYSGPVFVVDQMDPRTGKFDEHKAVIGAGTLDEARALYLSNYDASGPTRIGAITKLPFDAYRSWVRDGVKRKPIGDTSGYEPIVDRPGPERPVDGDHRSEALESFAVPPSFAAKHKVTVQIYDEATSSFFDGETDAKSALAAFDEDHGSMLEFVSCLRGGGSVSSCSLKHFALKSPIKPYRASMKEDVDALMTSGMAADQAWIEVAEAKLEDLQAERDRIDRVAREAFLKTPAGKRAEAKARKPATPTPTPEEPAGPAPARSTESVPGASAEQEKQEPAVDADAPANPRETGDPAEEPAAARSSTDAPADEADELTDFPSVAHFDRINVGPGGFIAPRPVAPGKPTYRETDIEGLNDRLREDRQAVPFGGFVADSPDLAIGQGMNRGVHMVFRPDAVSGREHSKPMTGDTSGREYRVDLIAPRALQTITMPAADVAKLRALGRQRLAAEFDREDIAGGRVRFHRKGLERLAPPDPVDYVAPAEVGQSYNIGGKVYTVASVGKSGKVVTLTGADGKRRVVTTDSPAWAKAQRVEAPAPAAVEPEAPPAAPPKAAESASVAPAPRETSDSQAAQPPKQKPRLGESAEDVYAAFKKLAAGYVTDRGIVPVTARNLADGTQYAMSAAGKLEVLTRDGAGTREATDQEAREFHEDLEADRLWIRAMTRPGFGSGYKLQTMIAELHSPSGRSFQKAGAPADQEPVKEEPRAEAGPAADTTAANQEPVKETPATAAKPDRLTDAGEELIRNRRGKLKGLAWDDVSSMNDTLKVAQVVKSDVWPRPDYAKMVEDGAPAWKAAVLKSVYDKLAAAPVTRATPTDADLKAYIETLAQIRETLAAELDRAEKLGGGGELWKTLKAGNVFGKVFPMPDGERVSNFGGGTAQGKDNNRRALLIGGNGPVQALQFSSRTLMKVRDLLADGFPVKQEAWQKSYEVRATETRDNDVPEAERTGQPQQRFYVYEKGSRYRLAKGGQDGGYATQDQAEAFARTLTTRKRETLPPSRGLDLADATRTGPDWRDGKDVTADQVMQHFGFRGVNLGEYVKAKQGVAQLHLNHVFDAFSDLADLLGVPPKAMSLNGTLGVAIGAQGSGKALAHFVPGVNEINITRDSGAGALAHEFGHAVDHYFATQHGRAASMAKRPYLSAVVETIREPGGVRPEVMDAMRLVMKTLNSRPMSEAEVRKYMEDQRALNQRRMDRWIAEFKGNKGADPVALSAVGEKLKRGDVGEPQDADVETNLSEFMRAAGLGPGTSIAGNAFATAYRLRDLADEARFMALHIPQVDTNYAKASAAMDAKKPAGEGYWSTPWEKFARAFETFAMDALKDRQRESLYLSGLVDSAGWQAWSAETGKAIPYPAGAERLEMQQAFQKLVDTIETREDDAGNVALLKSRLDTLGDGVPLEELRSMVSKIADNWADTVPTPQVVATAFDLPDNIQSALLSMGALNDTRGLMMPGGKTYLVANMLPDMATAQAVLFHEVYGHFGMRTFLGKSYETQMGILRMANPKLAAEANTWYAQFGQDQIDARVAVGMSREEAGRVVRALAVEEALADRAGAGDPPKAWKMVMAALQKALRRMGFDAFADTLEKMTEAETHALLMSARRTVLKGKMHAYRADPAPALDRDAPALSRVASAEDGTVPPKPAVAAANPEGPATPPKESAARLVQRKLQDHLNRFTVVRKWAEDSGVDLSKESNVWEAEERMHGRVATQLEDFREKRVRSIVEKVQKAGFTMPQVAEYLHAQHAAERNAQILRVDPSNPAGAGMTDEQASEILAAAPEGLAAVSNELLAITDDTRKILVDSGVVPQDAIDAWQAAYKHYVPLKGTETAATGTGKGLSVNGKQKRALGHSEREELIVENILRDHERAIMLAAKNEVGHSLLAFVMELKNPEIATMDAPEKRKVAIEGKRYEVRNDGAAAVATFENKADADAFVRQATNISGLTVHAVAGDASVAFMARPTLTDNEVAVYVRGHRVRVQLNDPLLAQAYQRLGIENLNQIMRVNREINAWLSRMYTGWNVEFFATNVARDMTTGLLTTTGKFGAGMTAKTLANYPKAMGQLLRYTYTGKTSPLIDAYRAAGGSTGAAYLGDLERIGKDVEASFQDYQGAIQLAAQGKGALAAKVAGRKSFRTFIRYIEALNAAGENALRMALFDAVRSTDGFSVEEAASASKNSTVNFNRRGEWGPALGSMYLFYNAAVQGTAAVADSIVNGKHRKQLWGAIGGLVGLGYLMAAAQFAGGEADDDMWDTIPDHIKARSIIVRTGEKTYATIPVPYGFAWFVNIGSGLYDLQKKGEPGKVAARLAVSLVTNFLPVNPFEGDEPGVGGLIELVPGAVGGELMRAGVRAAANRSGLGGTIVPEAAFDPNKPDHLKKFRTTTGTSYEKLATWLSNTTGGTATQGGAIDVSPETLKFWTSTLTGGTGKGAVDLADAASLKTQGAELTLREMPVIRKFYREEQVQDLRGAHWRSAKEAKTAMSNFARAKKELDEAGMQKIERDNGALLVLDEDLQRYNGWISEVRDEVQEIMANEALSKVDKRQRVMKLELEEAQLYREFRAILKDEKRAEEKFQAQRK